MHSIAFLRNIFFWGHPDFPVKVLQKYTWAHSLYLASPAAIQKAHRNARNSVFMLCISAEGTDEAANEELQTLHNWGLFVR